MFVAYFFIVSRFSILGVRIQLNYRKADRVIYNPPSPLVGEGQTYGSEPTAHRGEGIEKMKKPCPLDGVRVKCADKKCFPSPGERGAGGVMKKPFFLFRFSPLKSRQYLVYINSTK